MSEMANPFRGLVSGRVGLYLDEALAEYSRGRLRGAYDYALLALNSTLFELRAPGASLFEKLDRLAGAGKIEPEVVAFARGRDFLGKHDRGITDMDISYMTGGDLTELLQLLERLYRSLQHKGVALSHDPRGN